MVAPTFVGVVLTYVGADNYAIEFIGVTATTDFDICQRRSDCFQNRSNKLLRLLENVLRPRDNLLKGGDCSRDRGDHFRRCLELSLDDQDDVLRRVEYSRRNPDTFLRSGTHFLRL